MLSPIELVKCKLQVENVASYGAISGASAGSSPKFNGPLSVLKSILKSGGVAGLYKGFGPTLVRESFGTALWFGTYEVICKKYLSNKAEKLAIANNSRSPDGSLIAVPLTKSDIGPTILVIAGGTAGVVYNFCMFPVDVIKSRIQTLDLLGSSSTGLSKSSSSLDVAKALYKQGGIRAFYRGLGVTLLRAFPANASMFLTFEYLSRLFTSLHN
ncbi:Mitochondrial substrate carrier family protein S [Smittium culicis]|uniref:Mitochondrial substrate carrier family protein S n=1 Tax=Smittium culicis TaxID=133412 RepID=A0A1R1Y2C5_9FUNG|nr:Mitochondrial substrate carrier family protein S [Smittium culicis]